MMDILGAIGVDANRTNASELFADYVVERVAIDMSGRELMATSSAVDPKDKQDPFGIDVKKDYRASVKSAVKATDGDEAALMAALSEDGLRFPLFRCAKDGASLYVIPMVGSGRPIKHNGSAQRVFFCVCMQRFIEVSIKAVRQITVGLLLQVLKNDIFMCHWLIFAICYHML